MKLSINRESCDALAKLADELPYILGELQYHTDKLESLFHDLEGTMGPHEVHMENMVHWIRLANLKGGDMMHETACLIRSAAMQMGDYLGYTPKVRTVDMTQEDIRPRYFGTVSQRLNSLETHPLAAQLYEAGKSHIHIASYEFTEAPHYNRKTCDIVLDARADLHNPTGKLSDYFHEVGHAMDHFFGPGHSWLSAEPGFGEALRRDFERAVQGVRDKNHCSREDAYDIISEEVSTVWESGVSDIFGSLSGCRCQGDWGHSRDYWTDDPSRVEKEAFANMFEASIGDEHKIGSMKRWFPEGYRMFEKMLMEALA